MPGAPVENGTASTGAVRFTDVRHYDDEEGFRATRVRSSIMA